MTCIVAAKTSAGCMFAADTLTSMNANYVADNAIPKVQQMGRCVVGYAGNLGAFEVSRKLMQAVGQGGRHELALAFGSHDWKGLKFDLLCWDGAGLFQVDYEGSVVERTGHFDSIGVGEGVAMGWLAAMWVPDTTERQLAKTLATAVQVAAQYVSNIGTRARVWIARPGMVLQELDWMGPAC